MSTAFHVWKELGALDGEREAVTVEALDHADAARRFAQECTNEAGYIQPMPTIVVRRLDTDELKHCKVAPIVTYEAWVVK